MRQAADAAELVADPLGRFLVTKTWIYAYPDPAFDCTFVRGAPDLAAVEEMVAVWERAVRQVGQPKVVLFDTSAVESVDARAFATIARFITEHRDVYAQFIPKVAAVISPDFNGAVVAGFFDATGVPSEGRGFTSRREAMAWLGRPDLADTVEELAAMLREDGLVAALKSILLGHPSLAASARKLGLSPRSLQRRLGEAGTSFQRELKLVRVAAAERRLLETDDKIEAIAMEVGCGSAQTFSAMFRQVTGESPAEWRKKRRHSATSSAHSPSPGRTSKSSPGSG